MNTPTKTGWYSARWPGRPWACVLVSVIDDASTSGVYDPSVSRWRPLSDVAEWGARVEIDGLGSDEARIDTAERLAMWIAARDSAIEIASLRAELDALRASGVDWARCVVGLQPEIASLRAERDDALRDAAELGAHREDILDAARQLLPFLVGHEREFGIDRIGAHESLSYLDGAGEHRARRDCSLNIFAEFLSVRFHAVTADLAAASKPLGTMAQTIADLNDEVQRLTAEQGACWRLIDAAELTLAEKEPTPWTPTKTGWYRARWPGYTTWACVLVTVTKSAASVYAASVYDPGVARWRPIADVAEWGSSIDSLEAEIASLRGYIVTTVLANNEAQQRDKAEIASLRAELDALRAPESEHDNDRTKPPEHYSVAYIDGHDYPEHDYWSADPIVEGTGLGFFDHSSEAATDACWQHFDAVTAPLRAELASLRAELVAARAQPEPDGADERQRMEILAGLIAGLRAERDDARRDLADARGKRKPP